MRQQIVQKFAMMHQTCPLPTYQDSNLVTQVPKQCLQGLKKVIGPITAGKMTHCIHTSCSIFLLPLIKALKHSLVVLLHYSVTVIIRTAFHHLQQNSCDLSSPIWTGHLCLFNNSNMHFMKLFRQESLCIMFSQSVKARL